MTFWNIGKNERLAADIALLVQETGCDILALAETGDAHLDLTRVLQQVAPNARHITPLGKSIHVWTTLREDKIEPADSRDRCEAFKVEIQAPLPTLMVFVHLRSKVGRSVIDEIAETSEFASVIRKMEKSSLSAGRTIVVGDFNLHPYDETMLHPKGLGASASATIVAAEPPRRWRGETFDRFYNPTWNLLGDAHGPPGTYYWTDDMRGGNWYCLDQVLLRAPAIPNFLPASLRVVTSIGGRPLIAPSGKPAPNWSDHLPITFALGDATDAQT